MRSTLGEYERTLAQYIDARRNRPDQHSTIDEVLQDKKKLEMDVKTLQISFQNLHQRYEDVKSLHDKSRINESLLKQNVATLQQELTTNTKNVEMMKKTFEDKIER